MHETILVINGLPAFAASQTTGVRRCRFRWGKSIRVIDRSVARLSRPLVGRFPASLTGSLAECLATAEVAANRARGLRSQRFTVRAYTRRNAARCTRVRVTRAIHSTESAARVYIQVGRRARARAHDRVRTRGCALAHMPPHHTRAHTRAHRAYSRWRVYRRESDCETRTDQRRNRDSSEVYKGTYACTRMHERPAMVVVQAVTLPRCRWTEYQGCT